MSNFKVFNGFGIKPSKSYTAAGWDFYVPNVIDEEKKKVAYESFKKSYKKTDRELNIILNRLEKELTLIGQEDAFKTHNINILHLFLSLDGAIMRTSQNKVDTFVHYYLTWSDEGLPGVKLHCNLLTQELRLFLTTIQLECSSISLDVETKDLMYGHRL